MLNKRKYVCRSRSQTVEQNKQPGSPSVEGVMEKVRKLAEKAIMVAQRVPAVANCVRHKISQSAETKLKPMLHYDFDMRRTCE